MKLHTLSFLSAGILALSACSSGRAKPEAVEAASAPVSHNDQVDLAACEQIVKADLADEFAQCSDYSPEFRQMIRGAYEAVDEFGISILNADHRYKTQDGKPNVKSIGPAFREDARVKVPVVMQWPGNAPYTVAWILERRGSSWLITDLITSGHEHDNGSLFASLRSLKAP